MMYFFRTSWGGLLILSVIIQSVSSQERMTAIKYNILCYLFCLAPTSPTASSPTGTGTYLCESESTTSPLLSFKKTCLGVSLKQSISMKSKMRARKSDVRRTQGNYQFNHKNYNFPDCDWFKNSYFPLIHLSSCYRTVQWANRILSCHLNQPITTLVSITIQKV